MFHFICSIVSNPLLFRVSLSAYQFIQSVCISFLTMHVSMLALNLLYTLLVSQLLLKVQPIIVMSVLQPGPLSKYPLSWPRACCSSQLWTGVSSPSSTLQQATSTTTHW